MKQNSAALLKKKNQYIMFFLLIVLLEIRMLQSLLIFQQIGIGKAVLESKEKLL